MLLQVFVPIFYLVLSERRKTVAGIFGLTSRLTCQTIETNRERKESNRSSGIAADVACQDNEECWNSKTKNGVDLTDDSGRYQLVFAN